MSLFIQKQFFEVCLKKSQQKKLPDVFNNLKELLPEWYFQTDKNNSLTAMTIQLKSQRFKSLHYLVRIDFKLSPDILSISYLILHNNIPLKIQSRHHRIKLFSYFMRINQNILFGRFSICPTSGLLIYNYQTFLTQTQINGFSSSQPKFLVNNLQIFQKIQENCFTLEHYLLKIFQLANLTPFFQQNLAQKRQIFNNQLVNTYEEQLLLLKKFLPFIHQDINFLVKSNFHIKQNFDIFNISTINSILTIFQKNINLKGSPIPDINQQKIKEITWLSRSSSHSTINRQKTHKTQIYLAQQTLKKVRQISKNINCNVDLYSGLKFNSNEFHQKSSFYFIKKCSASPKGQKLIQRQKKFIQLLMQYGGKYDVGQYYNVSTVQSEGDKKKPVHASKVRPWQENSICMAYYPLNVGQYVDRRKMFMSQTSKLLLLLKIQKALSSLHREGSQHLDLKPENLMIDSQENIRLIDFGQSILQRLPLSSKPGVSIPYSPPQFFSKYKFNPHRCDIYSFGVMLHEILFGSLPQNLPSRKENALVFYQSATQYRRLFQFQPQNLQLTCEKKFAQLVSGFCMKCMNQNPNMRPSQSWIRVYLKKLIQLSYNY